MPTRWNRGGTGALAGVIGAGSVCLAIVCAAALAEPHGGAHATTDPEPAEAVPPAGGDTVFAEIPGRRALSDRLIVRPTPLSARRAALGDPRVAEALDRGARDRLTPHVVERLGSSDEYLVRVPAGRTVRAFARELLETGDYAYVEPDWILSPAAAPDDPLYSAQWHHGVIATEAAWDVAVGSPLIICAVCDTGVDQSHPDLASVLVEGANAAGLGPALSESEGGIVSDVSGHGTAVAGCVGAAGNNGLGVSGVAWSLGVMPVRVTDSPSGSAPLSSILKGARWAAENGARIINCSYEGVSAQSVQTTGEYVGGLGALFLWSAGNYEQNWTDFDHADVLVIGATEPDDQRTGFSAYGPGVDLFAPGVDIATTLSGGGYGTVSGTSFASAIVSGVAGLVFSRNPALSPEQARQILETTCEDLGPVGDDDDWGWGRVHAARAVAGAEPPLSPPGPFTIISPVDTASGVGVAPVLAWSESSEAGYYQIFLDDDPAFSSPEINATATGPSLAIEPGVLAFDSTYHWTVVAQNLLGAETWSPQVASFTTGPLPAPEPFGLVMPEDQASGVSPEARLAWQAAPYASSYRVTVWEGAPGGAPIVDETIGAPTTAITLAEGALAHATAYAWSVTAINESGQRGAEHTRVFITAPPPAPESFSLLAPENGDTGLPRDPTFAWTPSEGCETYVVEVADSPTFVGGLFSWEVAAPSIALTLDSGALEFETVYYWRVRAQNGSGEAISSPGVSSFATQAPPLPICTGDVDADGATNVFDFARLVQSYGVTEGATRADGDLDGNGTVDALDFAVFVADFGCDATEFRSGGG